MRRVVGGFTLIEILIVVTILGIVAALVVPQFSNAAQDADDAAIRSQLQRIRTQIEVYRAREGSDPPLIAQQWAPLVANDYLQQAPVNPLNDSALIAAAPSNSPMVGWVWRDKGTGTLMIYATDETGAAEIVE